MTSTTNLKLYILLDSHIHSFIDRKLGYILLDSHIPYEIVHLKLEKSLQRDIREFSHKPRKLAHTQKIIFLKCLKLLKPKLLSFYLSLSPSFEVDPLATMIPLLSCTAPRWEDKQDEMEKVSLSEEEKKAIEDDIFGNRAITREAPAMVAQARTLIQDAIDLIPDEQKEAYFRALVQCPELVRSESEPLRFLRCEAFNAWVRMAR
jgi:hypothetical protein